MFTNITKVDDTSLDLLINLFSYVTYKKNEEIIKEGEIAEYFYFIYKGIIKIYYFYFQTTTIVLWKRLLKATHWLTDYQSI